MPAARVAHHERVAGQLSGAGKRREWVSGACRGRAATPPNARRRTPCERRCARPAARAAHPERTAAGVDLAVSAGHEARPTVTGR